jgi:hypothetical protein
MIIKDMVSRNNTISYLLGYEYSVDMIRNIIDKLLNISI